MSDATSIALLAQPAPCYGGIDTGSVTQNPSLRARGAGPLGMGPIGMRSVRARAAVGPTVAIVDGNTPSP